MHLAGGAAAGFLFVQFLVHVARGFGVFGFKRFGGVGVDFCGLEVFCGLLEDC